MATYAIRTEGLSKRYGSMDALADLDLEVQPGEVVGYLGPNGAGKTTTIRLLLGLIRPTAGRGEIFGLDCQRQAVQAHRRLSYVAGEANLWPSLTGAETLHLLGRIQGRIDEAYRDELTDRFDLDPAKKVRAYSKGNRQKLILIGALCDRVGILRSGRLVEMGTMAQLRHLSALTVEATFETTVPDLSKVEGVTAVQVDGRVVSCQVHGSVEPLLKVLAGSGVQGLLSREPSLEELFLAHYGTAVDGALTDVH